MANEEIGPRHRAAEDHPSHEQNPDPDIQEEGGSQGEYEATAPERPSQAATHVKPTASAARLRPDHAQLDTKR